MNTITERVERGAALLDEHDPDWWRADVDRAIDLERLNLSDGDACILGQRCPLEAAAAYRARPGSDDWDDKDEHVPYSAFSEVLFGGQWNDKATRAALLKAAHDHGFASVGGELSEFFALADAWSDLILGRRAAASVTA